MNWAYLENLTQTYYGFDISEADKDIQEGNLQYFYNDESFLKSLDKPSEM